MCSLSAVCDWESVRVAASEGLDCVVERVVGVDDRCCVGDLDCGECRVAGVLHRGFEVGCCDHAAYALLLVEDWEHCFVAGAESLQQVW